MVGVAAILLLLSPLSLGITDVNAAAAQKKHECHVVSERTIHPDPELWVKIDSLNYIVRPTLVKKLPNNSHHHKKACGINQDRNLTSTHPLRSWLVCFFPIEAGEHLITVREEYDSLQSALRDPYSDEFKHPNPNVTHWALVAREFACSPFRVTVTQRAHQHHLRPRHYWKKLAHNDTLQRLIPLNPTTQSQPNNAPQLFDLLCFNPPHPSAEWIMHETKTELQYKMVHIVGDSTVEKLCRVIGVNSADAGNSSIPAVNTPQPWQLPVHHQELQVTCSLVKPKYQKTEALLKRVVDALIESYQDKPNIKRAIVFNEAGLWQTKLSSIATFHAAFPKWLDQVLRLKHYNVDVFWMSTVAIHPIHFYQSIQSNTSDINADVVKQSWQFTEPRVEMINQIARKFIEHYNQKYQDSPIRVVHAWELTTTRDDAPCTPDDMRHYNTEVYSALAHEIIATLTSHQPKS